MLDLINFFLSLDKHLIELITNYGIWAYAMLFLIIFCETGLVVTPFLPGDSILFIAGSLCSQVNSSLKIAQLIMLLVIASYLGNQVNYYIGRFIGKKVFAMEDKWYLNQAHLHKARMFYVKYGKMALIMARFMPIIRTFVPFFAGVVSMDTKIFTSFNFIGAIIWIGSLLLSGFFLGQIAFVQEHLNLIIYAIILFSILPSIFTYCKKNHRLET